MTSLQTEHSEDKKHHSPEQKPMQVYTFLARPSLAVIASVYLQSTVSAKAALKIV